MASRLSEFCKLRTRFNAINTQANSLVEVVGRDGSWAWANNSSNIGQVKQLVLDMQRHCEKSALSELLSAEQRDLKSIFKEDVLLNRLGEFLKLEGSVKSLEMECANLHKMQRVRRSSK